MYLPRAIDFASAAGSAASAIPEASAAAAAAVPSNLDILFMCCLSS
jgi:hypothetical protein